MTIKMDTEEAVSSGTTSFVNHLRRLEHAAAFLGSGESSDASFDAILVGLAAGLGAVAGAVYRLDNTTERLILEAALGLQTKCGSEIPLYVQARWIQKLRSTEQIIIDRVRSEPAMWSFLNGAGAVQEIWLAPILSASQELLGCLAVFHSKPKRIEELAGEMIRMLADGRILVIARDITDRKRAEEELQKQERLLRAVADATGTLLTVRDHRIALTQALEKLGEACNADRVYIFENHEASNGETVCSQRYEWARLGVEPRIDNPQLQNMPIKAPGISRWYEILSTGNCISGPVRNFPRPERKFLESESILSLLIVPILIDGRFWGFIGFDDCHFERVWSKNEESILTAAAGTIGAAIARKLAETALRTSEERYRLLFESNPQPMWVYDHETFGFLAVNQAAIRHYGYSRDEFLSMTIKDIRPAEDVPALLDTLLEHTTGLDVTGNRRHRKKNGTIIDVEITSHELSLGGGRARLVLANDITERKQTEEALRVSEERFSKAFKASPLSMSILTLKEGRYFAVNDTFLQVTGYTREDVIGRTANELDIWVKREDRADALKMLYESGSVRDLEVTFRLKNGGTCVGLFSAETMTIGGVQYVLTITNDITERKRTEEALRASEERFSKAFNASPLPMSIVSLRSGRCIDVNDTFISATGYSREEIIGHTAMDLDIWAEPAERKKAVARLFESGCVRDLEARFKTKAGEIRIGLFSAETIDLGNEVCVLTTTHDITERKQREEQVQVARREWQTTFDAMTDSVMLIGRDDRLIRANRAFYEVLGLTPDQCLGQPVTQLLHRNNEGDCPICELRLKGERGAIEVPAGVISKSPIFASIDPILDENGNTVAVVQVARDLSDLYRAREQAERDRTMLTVTIEQMAEGLIVCDHNGNVIHANRHAQEIFGFSLETMLADRDRKLPIGRFSDTDGTVLEVADLPIQTAVRKRTVVHNRRLWYASPTGRRSFVSITASPFTVEDGKVAGAVSVIRDVTEQQKEHERNQQADKLRALGQLASGVAHNFNNALAAVIGYTQLALRKVKDPEVEKYLAVIEQSAKDAAHMVERIQNFSRGQSRTDDFISAPLTVIVRDAVEITRPRWCSDAEILGIKYDVTIDWHAPEEVMVLSEPSELREVFVNIILNSLDAMPAGGVLIIKSWTDDNAVSVSFTDTGAGMTEEIKRRVFEPFFTTKGVAGLGMGMSESYRIVERHGGRIDVESQPHKGATFTVTLPIAGLSAPPEPIASYPGTVPSVRALVIDDEEPVRQVLAAILLEQGHSVIQAAGADQALALLRDNDLDVIFTDLAMPRIDGIMAAAEIKARYPEIKVVLMTGYGADKAHERAGDGALIDAAISKPFSFSEIQEVIEKLGPRR